MYPNCFHCWPENYSLGAVGKSDSEWNEGGKGGSLNLIGVGIKICKRHWLAKWVKEKEEGKTKQKRRGNFNGKKKEREVAMTKLGKWEGRG